MVAPTEIAEATIAALIIAMGLVALVLGAARWKSGDRSAVWFAVFAFLYGRRLAGQSQLFQPALPEVAWRYLGAFVAYIIVAPLAWNPCSARLPMSQIGGDFYDCDTHHQPHPVRPLRRCVCHRGLRLHRSGRAHSELLQCRPPGAAPAAWKRAGRSGG